MTLSIDTVTAYIAANEDGEGIMSFYHPENGWMPMVAADQARVDSLRPLAEQMGRATGVRVIVAEFSVRKDIAVIEPDAPRPGDPTFLDVTPGD